MNVLRPSASDKWLTCTGYATLPVIDESTKFTALGNELHQHLASVVDAVMSDAPYTPIPEFTELYDYLKAMREASEYLDYPITIKVEERLENLLNYEDLELAGTPDIVIDFGEFLEIVDYKSGYQVVAPDAPQLKCYALLAELKTKKPVRYLTVVGTDYISTYNVADGELDDFEHKVLSVMKDIKLRNTKFVPGKHCQFCAYKTRCREYMVDASPLTVHLPDYTTLANEELGKIDDLMQFLKIYAKGVTRELSDRLLNRDETIDGYCVYNKRGKRVIKDTEGLKTTLLASGYTLDQICTLPTLKALTHLEKLKGVKKLTKDFTEKSEGGAAFKRTDAELLDLDDDTGQTYGLTIED